MDKQADKQTDRQLERSDGLTMHREIVKGLMVMEERLQSHRQIIRQAANAELLAADHSQTRSTSICHVLLRKQLLSCQSFTQFDRLFNTCYLLCVCKFSFSSETALPIHD